MSTAVYILFGRTGSGKSHIANLLEERGVFHIDGDKHITKDMRRCLEKDEQMTPEMIDVFVQQLIQLIGSSQQKLAENFIVSQALYLNAHRQRILEAIPQAQFVHIRVSEATRAQRIQARYQAGLSKVSLEYAMEMDKHFEFPTHPVIQVDNNHDDEDALLAELTDKLDLSSPLFSCDAIAIQHSMSL